MMKLNLFEINEHEMHDQATQVQELLIKLEKVKQRLLILFGAVIMFFILGTIEPMMDADPTPQIWIFLWGTGLVNGIVMLVSSKWRRLPLSERRDCAIGSLAISLVAFGYLPLYLFINGSSEEIPFVIAIVIGGFILAAFYKRLGRPVKAVELIDEMFP